MVSLLVVGFVAGLITGISPCILPVLPMVLVAGATGTAPASRRWRSVAVVVGLVVSFSFITLLGTTVLSALRLPQDLLRDAGLVVLGLFGLSLLVPAIERILERPFLRLHAPQPATSRGGFVLGLGLGAVFVPCAGPVLAAISVIGATNHLSFAGLLLTLAFAAGAGIPLLAVALAGDAVIDRVRALRDRARGMRIGGGAVLLLMALAIGLNLTDGLQQDVPGYTSALQSSVEGGKSVQSQLQSLTRGGSASLMSCTRSATLQDCFAAPNFQGIAAWLNTAGGAPLSVKSLRGKVVLIDFWTYSCINCQRSLPHVEAWYQRYRADGLVVVGVHTPEFAFEHVVSNVRSAVQQFGITYPVAVDNSYDTWNAYDNEYWPADYLIDASGEVRYESFGEGQYGQTETAIRQLLVAADPRLHLPPTTAVPDLTDRAHQPRDLSRLQPAPVPRRGHLDPGRRPGNVHVPQLHCGRRVRPLGDVDDRLRGVNLRCGCAPRAGLRGQGRLPRARRQRHPLPHARREGPGDDRRFRHPPPVHAGVGPVRADGPARPHRLTGA
jgi:cytochrome c biogenesis protein CcdA/thiol-disulfide isomerase/thioredoxin